MRIIFLTFIGLLGSNIAIAQTTYDVIAAGGGDYTTIQACEDSAVSGDTCQIHNGSYTETVTVSVANLTFSNNSGHSPTLTGRFDINANNVTLTCNVGGGTMRITGWRSVSETRLPGVDAGDGLTGTTVTGCQIDTGYGPGIYSRNSTASTFDNNTVFGTLTNAIGGLSSSGISIISGSSTDSTYANGITISNNTVYDNWIDGISVHGEYVTIIGNTVYDNINTDWQAIHPDGIQLIDSTVDSVVGVDNIRIVNNLFRNHSQNIFIEGDTTDCDEVWVVNNVVYNESATVNGVDMDIDGSFKNLEIKGCSNVHLYGNYFGRSSTTSVHTSITGAIDNGTLHFKNNIFTNELSGQLTIEEADDFSANELDYNRYNTHSTNQIRWDGTFYDTLAAFKVAVTNQEVNGSDGDPDLQALPAPAPNAGSPVIDDGVDVSATCTFTECSDDFVGFDRGAGAGWDIGPYENTTQTPPSIDTTLMDDGSENVAYSFTLVATGGATPYVWTNNGAGTTLNDSDADCAGLTVSTAGVVSGTPTVVGGGTCSWTALVTDDNSQTDTQALTITIAAAVAPGSVFRMRFAGIIGDRLHWDGYTSTTDPVEWFELSEDGGAPVNIGLQTSTMPFLVAGLVLFGLAACNVGGCSAVKEIEVEVQPSPPDPPSDPQDSDFRVGP